MLISRVLHDRSVRAFAYGEQRFQRRVKDLACEVLEVRPSKSRPDHGLIKVRTTALNQNGDAVQVLVANLMVPRRSSNIPRESSVKAG